MASRESQHHDPMARYRELRDFAATPEPEPIERSDRSGTNGSARRAFVAQSHRARARHVDLRLEHRGALLSWAVPKGPTLAPGVRRRAVRTEDHPLAYAWFEGVIPSGYGAGDMIVWDAGHWLPGTERGESIGDDTVIDRMLEEGRLRFVLQGDKLAGRFTLVRTGDDQWLLMHARDEHAVDGWAPEDPMVSVLSGRSNDDVRAGRPASWAPADAAELAALLALGERGTWEVQGRTVSLTNLDKVLIPGTEDRPATTKRALVAYYAIAAPLLAPYLAARPVNLHRFPDGTDRPGFWQRSVPQGAPDWIRRWDDPAPNRRSAHTHVVFDGAASLAWAANLACVEIHPWTSTAARPALPSWCLFDIDPGTSTTWEEVLVLARLHRAAFAHLGIEGCAKVTGGRGIHVWVPVSTRTTFDATQAFAAALSRTVGEVVPELVSWNWAKRDRGGLARLDHTQNGRHKTLAAPFSVRARPGAPVSVPIGWHELDDPSLRADRWTIHTVVERVRDHGDPMAALVGVDQDLPDLRRS